MGLQIIDGGKNIRDRYHSRFEKLGMRMDRLFDQLRKFLEEYDVPGTSLFILLAITTEYDLDRM